MASNRGVAYIEPGKVEVQSIDYPKLALGSRKCDHGVILKIVATNICGSDQHMVRGRTTAPPGLILGHEITGEVIEAGRDVEFINVGDLVSVPFNIACGRCRNCKEGNTGICMNVNPGRPCKRGGDTFSSPVRHFRRSSMHQQPRSHGTQNSCDGTRRHLLDFNYMRSTCRKSVARRLEDSEPPDHQTSPLKPASAAGVTYDIRDHQPTKALQCTVTGQKKEALLFFLCKDPLPSAPF